jgi:pyridoxamine 5'-phosphate oxidase
VETLTNDDHSDLKDPFALFGTWLAQAENHEPEDANAMALATVDSTLMPNVRMVLLKGFDANGFVFYTNSGSAKGQELGETPKAAFVFHWKSLRRQIRGRGTVRPVTPEEADAYFSSRPRESQIGAWASLQSRPLEDRVTLEKRVADLSLHYALKDIPRPPHWIGYRITPESLEFWEDRPFRLHERLLFTRIQARWDINRLYP